MTTNYYLVIHGVSGDYSDKLLTGAFKVSDFEFLTQNNGTSSYDPLNLILDSDSYTALLTDLGNGTVISGVFLIGETTGGGGTPQITYDLNLSDAVVTALADGRLNTGLTLDYDKIGLVTTDIGANGKLQTPQSFGWDIANNAPTGSGTELTSSGATAVGATAPVTYYLLIDGFNGGSVDKAHTGWFAVSNFDIDASNTSNIQTGFPNGGTASFGDLSVNIQGDLAGLLADSGPGTALKGVKIEGVTADGTAVYDLEVANAKIEHDRRHLEPGLHDRLQLQPDRSRHQERDLGRQNHADRDVRLGRRQQRAHPGLFAADPACWKRCQLHRGSVVILSGDPRGCRRLQRQAADRCVQGQRFRVSDRRTTAPAPSTRSR